MLNIKQVAVIDCQVAGVSGDMILGALLDLGADSTRVVEAMKSVGDYLKECRDVEVTVRDVIRRGFRAKKVDVRADEAGEMMGMDLIEATLKCIDSLGLSVEAKRFASNVINTLVSVEAKIHGRSVGEVHLHEAGSIDTPAEIVGAAVALDDLNLFRETKIYSTPVAVGGGTFRFSHGTVSSPAPATLEILRSKGFPMIGGVIESELATPTGASLLVNLVHEATRFYPPLRPKAVGYGAGAKDFAEFPNVLRILVGEPLEYGLLMDRIYVLETNLDDVSGELVGYAINRLLDEGARDVSVIPIFTKKNRPGQIIKVITDEARVERLSRVLIEETGTLGVRMYPCERRILHRESIPIKISIGGVEESVKVKVAEDSKGEIVQIKPEYDDAERVAAKTGKPLRKIMDLVKSEAEKKLLGR